MVFAIWQATIVDDAGNALSGAQIEVRRETSGAPLATIYQDRDGETALGNPFSANAAPFDSSGFVYFYAADGAYKITATSGAFSRTWRYVPVGLAAEKGAAEPGASLLFDNATTDADPGAGEFRFNNANPISATEIYIDALDAEGNDLAAWIESFDDGGGTADRGTLYIRSADREATFIGRITGSVAVDGSPVGYYTLSVTPLAASQASTFVADARYGFTFARSGADGLFDGTETEVAAAPGDLIPLQDVSDGSNAKRSKASTIGAGKKTIWIPASAMKPDSTTGPAAGTVEVASGFVVDTLDFDSTADEIAYFGIGLPKGFSSTTTTLTFKAFWSTSATDADGVAIALELRSIHDNNTFNGSFGAAAVVTDSANSSSDQLRITDESSAITAFLTAGPEEYLMGKLYRDVSNVNDDMAEDMQLTGIWLYYTTDANTDD